MCQAQSLAVDSINHLINSLTYTLPSFCFFFDDTATSEIYTLSLHDALPISGYRPTPQDITDVQVKLDAALRQAGY